MKESSQKKITRSKIKLNDDNYYGNEADWQYMSVSQYKNFLKCPAAALAKLKGDWQPSSDPIALLVGNYVHSYFEDLLFMKNSRKKIKTGCFLLENLMDF